MPVSPPSDYYLVLVIFTAVTAFTLLLLVCCLVGMVVMLRKSIKKMEALADEAKAKAYPVLASAQALLDDIGPKLKTATSEFSDVSQKVRHQANSVNETLDSVLEKANIQIRRIDEMVTGTMDAVEQVSRTIESAVAAPTRRVSGVLRGIRVGMGVFLGREGEQLRTESHPRIDREEKPAPRPTVTRIEEPARAEGPKTVEFPHQKQA